MGKKDVSWENTREGKTNGSRKFVRNVGKKLWIRSMSEWENTEEENNSQWKRNIYVRIKVISKETLVLGRNMFSEGKRTLQEKWSTLGKIREGEKNGRGKEYDHTEEIRIKGSTTQGGNKLRREQTIEV